MTDTSTNETGLDITRDKTVLFYQHDIAVCGQGTPTESPNTCTLVSLTPNVLTVPTVTSHFVVCPATMS
jgi:hypothetical protein